MQKHKRNKKLINRSFQLKMIGVFIAIGCTCALFQIVLVNSGLLKIAKSAPNGGEDILRQARGMMLQNVAWTLGSMIPLMTGIGIILTHRVAGPAYRMTQHCKAIASGEPATKCTIRKNDELQELCDALNAAIEHLAPSEESSEAHVEKWSLEDAPALLAAASNDPESEDAAPKSADNSESKEVEAEPKDETATASDAAA